MEYGAAPSNACYGDDGAPALPREARRRRRDLRAGGLTLLGTAAALALRPPAHPAMAELKPSPSNPSAVQMGEDVPNHDCCSEVSASHLTGSTSRS